MSSAPNKPESRLRTLDGSVRVACISLARAVFDYFIGYKLGLTATPRDYLKKFNKDSSTSKDPREFERRLLLDTYRTFGCDDGQPVRRLTYS